MNFKFSSVLMVFSAFSSVSALAQVLEIPRDVVTSVAVKAPDACDPNTLLRDLKPGTTIEVVNRFTVYEPTSQYVVFQSGAMWGSQINSSQDVLEKDEPACKLVVTFPTLGNDKIPTGFVVAANEKFVVEGTTAGNGISVRGNWISQITCGTKVFANSERATVETLSRAMLGNADESNIIVHCPR